MQKKKVGQLNLANVRIGYRNFAGAEGAYNRKGDRNFVVFLEEEIARELQEEGWNIKWPKPNPNISEEEDQRLPYLQVSVNFDNTSMPPKVVLIAGDIVTLLDVDKVGTLDYADIVNVDLVINPYMWENQGRSGIKAYLKAIYVTLRPDPFIEKYGI